LARPLQPARGIGTLPQIGGFAKHANFASALMRRDCGKDKEARAQSLFK
jgi:hypothetical protein